MADKNFKAFRDLADEQFGYSDDQIGAIWAIAKQCSRVGGLPMATATGIATAGAGAVTLPIVGALPGWVAGTLAGFVSGTAICGIAKYTTFRPYSDLHRELDRLLLRAGQP